jgi:hypothetical protein
MPRSLATPAGAIPRKSDAETQLRALIQRHQTRTPDDPYLLLAQGQLEFNLGNYAKADEHLTNAFARRKEFTRSDPDDERSGESTHVVSLFLRCKSRLKKVAEAYARLKESEARQIFESVMYDLQLQEDGPTMCEIVQAHERRFPKTRSLLLWQAHALWFSKQFRDARDAYRKHLASLKQDPNSEYLRALSHERLFRCELRLNQPAAAAELLEEQSTPLLQALYAAYQGKHEQAADFLRQHLVNQPWSAAMLARDEDLRPALARREYALLKAEYPDLNTPVEPK